jgi:hypothetical protein
VFVIGAVEIRQTPWNHVVLHSNAFVVHCYPQASTYVEVGLTASSKVDDILISFLRMQLFSKAGAVGFCVTEHLTATSKVVLVLGIQLSIAAAMVLLYILVELARWCLRKYRTSPHPSGALARSQGRDRAEEPLIPVAQSPLAYGATDASQEGVLSDGPGRDGASFGFNGLGAPLSQSRRSRLLTAAVNFVLTAHTNLTMAALTMLRCVWVRSSPWLLVGFLLRETVHFSPVSDYSFGNVGVFLMPYQVPGTPEHERRLFIRASVKCDMGGWQAPYVALSIVLVAIPIVLPFLAAWARWSPSVDTRGWVQDVRGGVHRAVVEIYGRLYWWEAVMMLQRLVRGATNIFGAP